MAADGEDFARIEFEGWSIDLSARSLIVDGRPVPVQAKPFDVLRVLAMHAGALVTHDTLLDQVWPGRIVERGGIAVCVTKLRALIGSQAIATIPGIGYQLTSRRLSPPPGPVATPPDEPRSGPRAAPAVARPTRITNLPSVLPRLYGRDEAVAALRALLAEQRLVTVLGTGGVGKTRVAQAVAHAMLRDFRDGCWLVELASLDDPDQVPAAVAAVLGISLRSGVPDAEALGAALEDRDLLLVLDNCEHCAEAVARLGTSLLAQVPGLRLLVTSQVPLRAPEEAEFRLAGLAAPLTDSLAAARSAPAVELLITRVRNRAQEFAVTADNVAAIAEICRRLDGMPLSLELVAGRIPLLGVEQVRRNLDQRLNLLRGLPIGPERQQSLRAALQWSHGLLDPAEARVFRRAAVFVGNFGLEMMHAVLGEADQEESSTMDRVGGLAEKSLISILGGERPRYRLLESPRALALEFLEASGEAELIRRLHAEATLRLFEGALAEWWTQPMSQLVERYRPDLDNGRAALEWAAGADPALYIALAGALAWIWHQTGQASEGLRHCERAIALLSTDTPAGQEARLWLGYAALAHFLPTGEKLAAEERAVALYRQLDDRAGLYRALGRHAVSLALLNKGLQGRTLTEEMAALYDPAWPLMARWELLNARDFIANSLGEQEEAERLAEEQLRLARAVGDPSKEAFALMALEQCAAARGDFEEAVRLGHQILALVQLQRFDERMHVYVGNLATALIMCAPLEEAQAQAREMVILSARTRVLHIRLEALAMLSARQQRLTDAARLLGRAQAVNAQPEPVEARVRQSVRERLDAALSAMQLERLFREGAELSDEAAALLAFPDDYGLFRHVSAV